MGRTILSNAISKIGKPISKENNERRKIAIKDISACLERCYREFFKYDMMKNSQNQESADLAFKNAEKMVNLINELKGEINNELLRIACFDSLHNNDELKHELENKLDENIRTLKGNEAYETRDFAKLNVINDFEEMKKTMEDKKLDHILRYPIGLEDKSHDGKVIPLVRKREQLAPWQIRVMNGQDDGFFREATMSEQNNGGKSILDLNEYRQQKNDEGR